MSEVKPQPLVTFDNDPSNNKEVEEMLDEQIKQNQEKYKEQGITPQPLVIMKNEEDPGATNTFLVLLSGEYEREEFREWKLCYGRQEAYDFIKSFIEQIDLVESYIVSEKNTIEEKIHVIEFLRHVLETGKIEDPGFDPDDYMQGDYDPDEEE